MFVIIPAVISRRAEAVIVFQWNTLGTLSVYLGVAKPMLALKAMIGFHPCKPILNGSKTAPGLTACTGVIVVFVSVGLITPSAARQSSIKLRGMCDAGSGFVMCSEVKCSVCFPQSINSEEHLVTSALNKTV